MRAAFRLRLRFILIGIVLFAFLIFVRLYFVQIVHGEEYSQKADRQYVSSGNALFDRGSIYFTRKDGTHVSAATLATGFVVAINPRLITDLEAAYAAIAAIASTTVSHEAFAKAAGNRQAVYIEVAHHLSNEAGKTLAEKDLAGVIVLRERWRIYPGGTLAAQTIGAVALSASDDVLKGRTGIEARYEDVLSRSGDGLYKNFFAELFSNLGNALVNARDAREGDVVTTLEPEVETRLASDLAKVHAKYSSKESGGIIMDPKTGAIIAIATYPTYDANDFSNVPGGMLTNPLVSHVYEFGSIMKALTMASALDAGVITPVSTYNDTGCITLDTSTICNYDLKARGVISMQQILSQSLNMGAAHLAGKIGPNRFRSYFSNLGFGVKTGIDLPAEASGLISNLQSPRHIEYATAAFGQGIAITPIEMIRALGALANGGEIVEPHVASAIELDSGISKTLDWEEKTRVFSPEAVRAVSEMLTSVVDHSLAKGTLAIPTLSVAAKTGTAQLPDSEGGYSDNRYFHSFFGYFPSYAPRFIILLYTNDPQGVEYASETLTTTFMDLVHFLNDYYDVPPDRLPGQGVGVPAV
ncbi:MAG: penicillin-binding protein 2 [bacterium]|nr:penicillin-binding protein 2 [bacterium]